MPDLSDPPDLPGFLLARIAEDEAVARAASDGRWYVERREPGVLTDETRADVLTAGSASAPSICVVYDEAFGGSSTVDAAHIARHHPARVLAECAAKRAILEEHEPVPAYPHGGNEITTAILAAGEFGCRICGLNDRQIEPEGWCETLLALVQPFADHPDFSPEWRA